MGSDEIRDTLPSDDDPPAPDAVPWLIYVGSPEDGFAEAGTVCSLAGIEHVQIGRADDDALVLDRVGPRLDVRIPLRWVSADHASLRRIASDDGPRWQVHDHGSRNGVIVEGRARTRATMLRPGEIVEIGRSFWALGHGPEAALRAPAPAWASANPRMRQLGRALQRLAPSNVPILLVGETGVGKDHIARLLHTHGELCGELVHVGLGGGSVERQLLAPGDGDTPLRRARGGTLVLDEIGDLAPTQQTELLSVLLGHVPRSLGREGEDEEIRLVSTTTHDLRHAVAEERFRPDLLARLAGFEARVRPLRGRREDLGLLAAQFCRRDGQPVRPSVEVFRAMLAHPWPFNIRELEHSLSAAAAVVDDDAITLDTWRHIAWDVEAATTPRRIEAVRRELVAQLGRHGGELDAVAESLGVARHEVERWLGRFQLSPTRFR